MIKDRIDSFLADARACGLKVASLKMSEFELHKMHGHLSGATFNFGSRGVVGYRTYRNLDIVIVDRNTWGPDA